MKAALFIDGGHLRVLARQAGYRYNPDYIETVAHACVADDETILRVLYYDCAPYQSAPGEAWLLISLEPLIRDMPHEQ